MATENIIADYLLAAEQGNIAKLTACRQVASILMPVIVRGEPPLPSPA